MGSFSSSTAGEGRRDRRGGYRPLARAETGARLPRGGLEHAPPERGCRTRGGTVSRRGPSGKAAFTLSRRVPAPCGRGAGFPTSSGRFRPCSRGCSPPWTPCLLPAPAGRGPSVLLAAARGLAGVGASARRGCLSSLAPRGASARGFTARKGAGPGGELRACTQGPHRGRASSPGGHAWGSPRAPPAWSRGLRSPRPASRPAQPPPARLPSALGWVVEDV